MFSGCCLQKVYFGTCEGRLTVGLLVLILTGQVFRCADCKDYHTDYIRVPVVAAQFSLNVCRRFWKWGDLIFKSVEKNSQNIWVKFEAAISISFVKRHFYNMYIGKRKRELNMNCKKKFFFFLLYCIKNFKKIILYNTPSHVVYTLWNNIMHSARHGADSWHAQLCRADIFWASRETDAGMIGGDDAHFEKVRTTAKYKICSAELSRTTH